MMSVNLWQTMDSAPKDKPILVWANHEAERYHYDDGRGTLTPYGLHCEAFGHANDGWCIAEWMEGAWESDGPESTPYRIPAWWFVYGSGGEIPVNPVAWMPLPDEPVGHAGGNYPVFHYMRDNHTFTRLPDGDVEEGLVVLANEYLAGWNSGSLLSKDVSAKVDATGKRLDVFLTECRKVLETEYGKVKAK